MNDNANECTLKIEKCNIKRCIKAFCSLIKMVHEWWLYTSGLIYVIMWVNFEQRTPFSFSFEEYG